MENEKTVEPFVKAEQIAALCVLTPDAIYKMAREGRIPSIRISRRAVRFKLSQVLAALEAMSR